jgi:hypothetical protein
VWSISALLSEPAKSDDCVVDPRHSDISHVFFTSGSTGRPKGCIATHAALLAYCKAKNVAHEISATDTVLCASAHMFDPHLTDFFSALVAGATFACASRETTFTCLGKLLLVSKATHCLTTPVVLSAITDVESLRGSALRMVALGGELTPKTLAQTFLDVGVRVANTYGVTECVAYQTFREITDTSRADTRAVGDPLPGNTLVCAADPGDDPTVLATSGQLAELWIGGAQVGVGYLNRTELTSERFKHGLYRTGDVVRVCSNGDIILLGRRDDQVKISGQRVDLGEVEHAIRRACGVDEVKCVLTHCKKQLVAYCVGDYAQGHDRVASEAMRFIVSQEVPRHMVPLAFVFLACMPLTATGKVSRVDLCQREIPEALGEGFGIKLGRFGVDVADIWSHELGVKIECGDVEFGLLGGDSLAALRVAQRVKALIVEESNDEHGGVFGESLGIFAPVELMIRPKLNDYIQFIRQGVAIWPKKYDDDGEEEEEVVSSPSYGVMFRVVAAGYENLIPLLVDAGAPVEPKYGSTPLHVACANTRLACVKKLIELGAAVNAIGNRRKTPLLLAASSSACTTDIIQLLVDHGANLNATDEDHQTALHAAARAGTSSSVVLALLEAGDARAAGGKKRSLNMNALDSWGRTALHWASVNGHRNMCKVLLDSGVDANIKDGYGETARDIAERRALCSAQERPKGGRPSTWGDIANLLGGSGTTKHLKKALV